MKRRGLVVWPGLAVVAVTVVALGQFPAQAPILNLRLPIFSEHGFRIWELRGGSGRYVDQNHIELTSVRLQVFSDDEAGTLQLEITTPEAVVQPESRVVTGPGELQVIGRGFELFGNDWIYEDATKTLTVRRDVVATFKESIGDILR